jgi:hypothetical protein
MDTAAPAPFPLRSLWPALLAAAFALLVIYVVSFDQGALSQSGLFVHELMHDGRHLLGVPCH